MAPCDLQERQEKGQNDEVKTKAYEKIKLWSASSTVKGAEMVTLDVWLKKHVEKRSFRLRPGENFWDKTASDDKCGRKKKNQTKTWTTVRQAKENPWEDVQQT